MDARPAQVVLLPSPLLGPSVWAPVAERLRQGGWPVDVCRLPTAPTSPRDALAAFLEVLTPGRPVVLVPHSNAGLFPDAATRLRVEEEQQRLPLAYFRDSLPAPAGWAHRPNAYLAFGDTYDEERRQAGVWQWPVETLDGEHLHLLVAPDDVATTVTALLARLDVHPPGV